MPSTSAPPPSYSTIMQSIAKAEITHAVLTAALPIAKEFTSFVDKSVTPFHAVQTVASELQSVGYTRLPTAGAWPDLAPGQKSYFTRNDSSIVALRVGGRYKPGNGIKIIGAHTDSPNFAVKPKSRAKRPGFEGVAVQCYGGGLWHTWFDRELTVAGRVLFQRGGKGPLEAKLVKVDKKLLILPNLAIHLTSAKEREAFAPNKETHLVPLMASQLAADAFNKPDAPNGEVIDIEGHNSILFKHLAEQAGCSPHDIQDFDLSIVDTQPSAIAGAYDEFVCAPRIDNLLSCFCATKALVSETLSSADDDMITVIAFFDHEEVGSSSCQGAGGSMVTELIDYITNGDARLKIATVNNSFLLSVDGAHGLHPLYPEKHHETHRPALHEGPVIKYNANVRYATNGGTAAKLRALAKINNVPMQQFCVKNDSPCGSTIGPILSTLTGIKTVDIGAPMLAMHSIREMCSTLDVMHLTNLIRAFISKYNQVPLEEVTYDQQ